MSQSINETFIIEPSIAIALTGGTFSYETQTLTLVNGDGTIVNVTGFTDTYVTGGTYSNGIATFINNSGNTFTIGGFYTGTPITISGGTGILTGGTYPNFTITNTLPDQIVTLSAQTGISIDGSYPNFTLTNTLPDQIVTLTSGTQINISGTYPNFIISTIGITDTYVTGGTYSNGTAIFTNNTGGTFTVSGFSTNNATQFTGGTVTGATQFTNGLTTNSISATTYQNLPLDITVTGGTYSSGTATFTNNTGGTFTVSGFSTSNATQFTGGTVTGATQFTNGLSGNTISGGTLYGDASNLVNFTSNQITTALSYTPQQPLSGSGIVYGNNTNPVTYIAGNANQYVRGDGVLADFPSSAGGGGGSIYYFNGGTVETTISGNTFLQMSKIPSSSTGVNFSATTTGDFAYFLTDVLSPDQTSIPAGIWTFQAFFSTNSNSIPAITAKIYKYDGVNLILVGQSQPENIDTGSIIDLHYFAASVSGTSLNITDRIAVVFNASNIQSNKNVTLYTQDNTLSSVNTTFPVGIGSLNGLTLGTQYFTVSTSGTSFNIISSADTHTFNIPLAATNSVTAGLLSNTDYNTFNTKVNGSGTLNQLAYWSGATGISSSNNLTWNGSSLNVIGSISATTYYNLPLDIRVTGGTYSAGTTTFTNNTGGTFTVTGFSTSNATQFTGGTVTGSTQFTNGLTTNSISATTYQNLPLDIRVTGGTYSTGTATFTNNTGGTFTVTGFSTSNATQFTGGTVTGSTQFTNGLSANTISATTITGGSLTLTNLINLTGTTSRMVEVNTGGTVTATTSIISAYLTSGGTIANLLENTSNWDIDGNYTGSSITGTYQGQKHYNGNYLFEAVADNLFIRLIRG